jgi:ferredoxin
VSESVSESVRVREREREREREKERKRRVQFPTSCNSQFSCPSCVSRVAAPKPVGPEPNMRIRFWDC